MLINVANHTSLLLPLIKPCLCRLRSELCKQTLSLVALDSISVCSRNCPPQSPEIPKMSHADPDAASASSPPSFGRDWFFPAPSPYCAHPSSSSSAASAAKTPKYPRRFSTNPRSYSSSFSLDSKPPPTPPPHSFRSAPPVSSAPYREARYAGARRRLGGLPLRPERSPAGGERKAVSGRDGGAGSDRKPEAPAERAPSRGKGIGDLRRRLGLRLRWRMAFLVAVRLLCARAGAEVVSSFFSFFFFLVLCF